MTQHKVSHKGVDFLVSLSRQGHLEMVVFFGKSRRGVVLPRYEFGQLRGILDTVVWQLDNPPKKKKKSSTNDMIRRLNGYRLKDKGGN